MIWRGLKRLFDMVEMYSILNQMHNPSDFKQINEAVADIPDQ